MRARVPSRYDRLESLRRPTERAARAPGGVRSRYGTGPFRRGGGGVAAPSLDLDDILGSRIAAWYQAALANMTLNGAAVSGWDDLSASGYHVTQSTAMAQPAWSATGGPNGMPCVVFDGIDDSLSNTAVSFATATYDYEAWIVCRVLGNPVTPTLGRVLILRTDAGAHPFMMSAGSASGDAFRFDTSSAGTGALSTVAGDTTHWHLVVARGGQTVAEIEVDGTVTSDPTVSPTLLDATQIHLGFGGASNYKNIALAAVLVVRGLVTDAERAGVVDCFTRLYGELPVAA